MKERVAGIRVPWAVAALLVLHAAMVVPGIFRNSVTFDENFHLPAGALYLARGYTHVSIGQPPLARALYALPIMPMRPELPPDSILVINAERAAGKSFLERNAARFETLYVTARFVGLLMSWATGLLIFAFARGLYGPAAGLVALGAWVACPEAVAQAGLVGMDMPTALVFLAVTMAFRSLTRNGRARDVAIFTLAVGAALLTRYSVLQLIPVLLLLTAWAWRARVMTRPAWLLGALAIAAVGGIVLLGLGYLGQITMLPMGERALHSQSLERLAGLLPWLRLPLPDAYIAGFDYLGSLTEAVKPIYVLGSPRAESVWWYFPFAAAIKWPLGLLGLLVLRVVHALRRRGTARSGVRLSWDEACVLLPGLTVIAVAMTSDLAYGLRYLLPAMPFLCVWVGGLVAQPGEAAAAAAAEGQAAPRGPAGRGAKRGGGKPARRAPSAWALATIALVAAETLECAAATPWQLAHFNVFAGGRGDRLVNDSSVDWGQGLIALRDEMRRRGIERVSLTYHGTTDPALYGIDYIPFTGGAPDSSTPWIAVSSYYFVGLSQRMVTRAGDTEFLSVDFRPMWNLEPVARPGNCMYLFRLPGR